MLAHTEQGELPVTVRDVLALDLLVDAGLEVVAGHDALDREVQWVHAGEIPDIAQFLRGGELLLTAGTGIARSAQSRVDYIQTLADAGAAALVLEFGRAFRAAPADMVRVANEAGLPMATLRHNVPFAEVTRLVHARIVGRRYALQSRIEQMALELNGLLLSGGSIPQIVDRLHELTGKTICVEDAAHQLTDVAGPDDVIDGLLADWRAHSRRDHRRPPTAGDGNLAERACAWAPVMLRGEPWGRVHVIAGDTPLDALDVLAAERASVAVGLALLSEQHHQRLAERSRADLLDELARRNHSDPSRLLRQARTVSADFRGCDLVALEIAASDGVLPAALRAGATHARAHQLPILASTGPAGGRMLVGASAGQAARSARELAEALVNEAGGSSVATVGLSRPMPVTRTGDAFGQATECLRFARVSHATGVIEHATLGLHLLLASHADGPDLARFVEVELGPLLEHDAHARSPLLSTLEALLAHAGNRAEAARALHLERRSVYYRIKRIETILGQSLDDHNVRLGLAVALRALRLLEDRPALRGARL